MIHEVGDINHNSQEGRMLVTAMGFLMSYSRKAGTPFKDYNQMIEKLNECTIMVDCDVIINDQD